MQTFILGREFFISVKFSSRVRLADGEQHQWRILNEQFMTISCTTRNSVQDQDLSIKDTEQWTRSSEISSNEVCGKVSLRLQRNVGPTVILNTAYYGCIPLHCPWFITNQLCIRNWVFRPLRFDYCTVKHSCHFYLCETYGWYTYLQRLYTTVSFEYHNLDDYAVPCMNW